MEEQLVKQSILDLLASGGVDARDIAVELGDGGGNNRVFIVHAGGTKYLAKAYFSSPTDTRNRLGAEYSFLSYAWKLGMRCVPKPISRNAERNIGLYEFVDGTKLSPGDVGAEHVRQAAEFISQLNASKHDEHAHALPPASEACFTVDQHFTLVDRRVARLRDLPVDTVMDRDARDFVSVLDQAWGDLKNRITHYVRDRLFAATLDDADRCISPSDFGFHNALVRGSGDICFIDFEYAGWDDPAKLIGDFFSQPRIPVPLAHFDLFARQALQHAPHADALIGRARHLLPMFQLKWCCIILNEFLPDAARRRQFANPNVDPDRSKRAQLEKAQKLFNSITR